MKNKKIIIAFLCAVVLFASAFAIVSFAASDDTSDGLKITKQDDSVYDLVSSVTLDYAQDSYEAKKKLKSVPETVEAWVFYPSGLNGAAAGPVVGNYNRESSYGEAFINFEIHKNGHPRIWCADEFAYNHYDIIFENATVPTDTWTHVTYVYDNESGVASCYINGALAEEKYFYPALVESVTDFPFVLAGDQRTANSGYFKGEVKDVAMFSDVRSAEEVASDYVSVAYDTEGLLCYYDVDASDIGKDIKDETGNGYDLKYSKSWLCEAEMEEIRKGYGDFKADYSFAVFGDIQRITEDFPNLLAPMYQWVVDNKDSKNIVYSLGLGDITDDNGYTMKYSKDENGNWIEDDNGTYTEWDIAEAAISVLDGYVPYSLIRGNHDIMKSYDYFNTHFADNEHFTSQFEGDNGGKYTDTGAKDPVTNSTISYANTWRTFTVTVDGIDVNYLFLNLDYGASDEVLAWASGVISQEKYKDYKVIVSTHCYLYADGTTEDAGDATPPSIARDFMNNGDDIWDEFVSKHANIEMVLSGHVDSNEVLVTRSNAYIDGEVNVVTEMLINPQAIDYRMRSGLVAMFYFDASENKVAIEYYSPTRDAYYMTANQFVIDLDDSGADKPNDAWDGTTLTAPEGSGTENDPYLISNPSNLLWLSYNVINGSDNISFSGKYFKQNCDIDLDGKAIQSIGYYFENHNNMRAFGGNYDGGGYSIKNGTITSSTDSGRTPAFSTSFGSGLFGAIYNAVIKNVVLENIEVVGRGVSGAIVGIAASPEVETNDEFVNFNILSGCVVKDTVKIVALNNETENAKSTAVDNSLRAGRIGSICGMSKGTLIEGCTSAASIKLCGVHTFAGGIAGTAGLNTVIDNCAFTGSITLCDNTATSSSYFGGIIGAASPSDKTTDDVGAATRAHGDLTVTNCYSTASYQYMGSGEAANVNFGDIIGYSTLADGNVYTANNCLTEQNSVIDDTIAGIKESGTERVWSIGEGEPSGTANDGAKYLDTASGTYYSYTNSAWNAVSNLGMATSSLETPYGTISEEHRASPIVVFKKNGEEYTFYGGYATYYDMTYNLPRTQPVVVYFRADISIDSYSTNFGWNVSTVIFDLGGHTLYQTKMFVFPAVAKYSGSYASNPDLYGKPGYYEIKNGNIVLYDRGLFDISAYGAMYNNYATDTNYKSFYYNFDNVNISLAEGATVTSLIGRYGESSSVSVNGVQKMNLNVKLEDNCTIDISNATEKITLFDANDTKYAGYATTAKTYYNTNSIVNVEVGAINVISDSNSFTWYSVNENNGSSVVFLENESGGYATLTVPSSLTPTTDVNLPGNKTFEHDLYKFSTNSTEKTVTYTLTETPYGGIGSTYSDLSAYPFVIFKDNGDETYKIQKGYSAFGTAVNAAKSTNDTSVKMIVYVRKDTNTTLSSTNLNWSVSTIVIDLGGHTVTPDTYFLPACAKWNTNASWKNDSVYGEPGYYEITNGEIVLNKYGLFQMYAYSATYNSDADDEHYKSMYFKFDSVKITLAEGATLKSITGSYQENSAMTSGNKKMLIDIKYNNCVFDVREAVNTINFFNANDSKYTGLVDGESYYNTNTVVNISVKGAKLITGNASINFWTANSANGSWVKFIPDENGNYVTLSRSKEASYPNFRANDKTLEFVKTGEETDTYVYSLAPAEFNTFVPKMSITLANNFIMNIYVPVNYTQKFTFNNEIYENLSEFSGEIKTLDDGYDYYLVTVPLDSSEAAKELQLVAEVTIGDDTATATFTFSITRYAAKLLNDAEATEVEIQLIKDVLAYIKAAYIYFDVEDKEEVSKIIDEILGDYDSNFVKIDGSTNTENGLLGVVIVLNAKPCVRFIIPDGATVDNYTFKSGSTNLNYTSGTMTIDGIVCTYAEVSLYAYQLIKEITYSNGDYSGCYHINSYYDFITTDEKLKTDVNLTNLVEKLYNYCKSAENYRVSVTAS